MTPLELVAHISEGLPVTPADLDAFLAAHRDEGQHLDYKSGQLTDDGQGTVKLRRHVTGMANVAGGVLIIGVRDDKTIDGVNAKGGRGAKGWAENSVSELAAYFTTPPHFCEVAHASGTVLVVAIHRNGRLIPVVEKGRLRYYLRLGDQTMEVPEVLVTDLLHGRRELPIVELRAERCLCTSPGDGGFDFSLDLDLFNEGSIWVEEVQVGLIGLHAFGEKQPKDKLPNSMRANLDVAQPDKPWVGVERIGLHRHTEHRGKTAPLDGHPGIRLGTLKIDANMLHGLSILYLKAAVFCIPRHGTIQWYQLSCAIAKTDHHGLYATTPKLVPVNGELVSVAWHRLKGPPNGLDMAEAHDWEAMLNEQQAPK